ncbi:MAG: PqqD family peptide modification chaperone, partial [Acidobacteria bacterium]|nr:PqqD family peptide modification chaperone [Acidobacteriota bacterium]
RLVRTLAGKLEETLGRPRLRRCRFAAIPRGGWIVLGMLAEHLDLPSDPRDGKVVPDETLVVVDDCALSGARFGRFLAGCDAPEVVFAHLLSHPGLRDALLHREPRLAACLAAEDLVERKSRPATEREAWRQRWQRRTPELPRYWLGELRHLAFPWGEPDRTLWDGERGRPVTAWRLISPEFCLKNRPGGPGAPPVEVLPSNGGAVQLTTGVFYSRIDEGTAVVDFASGASLLLSETAGTFLEALLAAEDLDGAHRKLAERYRVEPATLHRDLAAFAEEMSNRGFLAP